MKGSEYYFDKTMTSQRVFSGNDTFMKKGLCKQEIKTQRGFNKSFNKLIIKRLKENYS